MAGGGHVAPLAGNVHILGGGIRGHGTIGDDSAVGSCGNSGSRGTRRASRAGKVEERLLEVAANDAERRVRCRRSVVVAEDVPPDIVVVEELTANLIPVGLRVLGRSDSLVLGRA